MVCVEPSLGRREEGGEWMCTKKDTGRRGKVLIVTGIVMEPDRRPGALTLSLMRKDSL